MIVGAVAAAAGGALGATVAYRLSHISVTNRATVLLVFAGAAAFVMGAIARFGTVAHSTLVGAFLTGLCGTAVSFVALGWHWAHVESDQRRTGLAVAVIAATSVAMATVGYLAVDLLGFAYVKFPSAG